MKILLLNDSSQKVGGAEVYFYNLKGLLMENGYDVETYFSSDDLKLHVLGSIFSLRNLINSFRKIKQFDPDIVHLHKYNLSLSLTPLISAKLLRKRTLVTFNDFGSFCCNGWCVDSHGIMCHDLTSIGWVFKRGLGKKKFFNKLYDYFKNQIHILMLRFLSDIYIGPSKIMTHYLKKIFPPLKVRYIPYFIKDSWKFHPIKKSKYNLLFVGRFSESKGINVLIKAVSIIKQSIPRVKLLVIGQGENFIELNKSVKSLSLKDNVLFLGQISNDKLMPFYHKANVFIMPSILVEQFGIGGIESLACGTPVVGSNIGGIPEWCIPGRTGFLAEPGDEKSLAENIISILIDQNLSKSLAENGRKLFQMQHTPKKHISKLGKTYKFLIKVK